MQSSKRRLFWSLVIPVVALDAITKLVAENQLLRFAPVQVVSDVVQFRLVYNPGAAFGLNVGPHSRWVFFGLAVLALVVLGAMLRGTEAADKLRIVSLSLICAGAVGNLVDRIRSPQGVVDFIDVGIGTMRWPTFNVADIAVSLGAIALAVSLWREERAARLQPAEPSADTSVP